MWDEITNPFRNFNGCTVEVWEWICNFIPHFTGHMIIYPCWDYSWFMLRGPRAHSLMNEHAHQGRMRSGEMEVTKSIPAICFLHFPNNLKPTGYYIHIWQLSSMWLNESNRHCRVAARKSCWKCIYKLYLWNVCHLVHAWKWQATHPC